MRDFVVVPLNHLGIDLYKTINTNYSELRERRAGRRVTVTTSTSYSFLSQEADRHLTSFQVMNTGKNNCNVL